MASSLLQFALLKPQSVSLGQVPKFESDYPIYLALNQENQTLFLWIVKLEGEFCVFDARATPPAARSQNCIVQWIDEAPKGSYYDNFFVDPCVGGYWWKNGEYFGGPAPRNLDSYTAIVRDGELWIDLMYPQIGESWLDKQ